MLVNSSTAILEQNENSTRSINKIEEKKTSKNSFKKESFDVLERKTTLVKQANKQKQAMSVITEFDGGIVPDQKIKTKDKEICAEMKAFFVGEKAYDRFIVTKELLQHDEETFKTYHQIIRKEDKPKASLLMVHGAGEHGSRNIEAAMKFADLGYKVHLFDIRGHGYSSGPVLMMHLDDIFEGISKVLTRIEKNTPLYLFGHSMGGASVLNFINLNPQIKVSGVITSSAFVDFPPEFRVKPLSRVLLGNLPEVFDCMMLSNRVFPLKLTRSVEEIEMMVKDKKLVPAVTVRFIKTLLKLSHLMRNHKKKIGVPVFMMTGRQDRLTLMKYGKKVYEELETEDKTFYIFKNGIIISKTRVVTRYRERSSCSACQ